MVGRAKYKKAMDLYVLGTEVVLRDGSVIWIQALNPFEHDEAQRIAGASRARFQIAMREYGSDEMVRFQAQAAEMSMEVKAKRIAEVKSAELIQKAIGELESDEEWAEVRAILDRSEELQEGTEEEKRLIADKNREYIDAINERVSGERDFLEKQWLAASVEDVDEALREMWVDHIAADKATREYELVEVFYGARACEGSQRDDGTWDHSSCEGHILTAFESKDEVRRLPSELYEVLREAFNLLNMHPMDPKESGSPASSSEPSPLPSEQEGSSPSTPEGA